MSNREGSLRLKRLERKNERYDILPLRRGARSINNDACNGKKINFFMKTLTEYTSTSVIHGVSYTTPDGRMAVERVIWVILVSLAFAFAAHEVRILYEHWQENPVLTVLDTVTLPIEDVEFPAITICPQGSSKDIMNAALFDQFKDFVLNKTEFLNKPDNYKTRNKRDTSLYSHISNFSYSDIISLTGDFIDEVYGGIKVNPTELIQLLTSDDPDSVVENKPIWVSEEANDCSNDSYDMIIDRLNQELNPKCPNDFETFDRDFCIHFGEEIETYAEAEFYCEDKTFGSGGLLMVDTLDQLNNLTKIVLKGTKLNV